ncbi:MAG: class I SAM-dependent methyltransferase [Candidatus Margulisbacteria bacterium]|nr:class I SAM-dependent methyltransferase [Candidatus Margulisiibacteriota bacterium]
MKIRDSGMPEREMWEGFFSPEKILETLGLGSNVINAAEFGCGYGTFTIPAARLITGKLFAFDIEPEMVAVTKEETARQEIKNVEVVLRDFMADGTGLKPESVDYAMLFNILHLEDPVALLLEANRILKQNGKIGIIHWNYDSSTPRGPLMDIRPRPEQCIEWAKQAGFSDPRQFDLKPYHYGIVMSKKEESATVLH